MLSFGPSLSFSKFHLLVKLHQNQENKRFKKQLALK